MIPHTYIKAALLFAAKNDVRYYLKGALYERTATETRIVATNGHAMIVARAPCEGVTPMSVIIPRETLETVARWKQAKVNPPMVDVTGPDATGKYTISQGDNAALFTPIDGKFPSYRSVVPGALSGELAQFDPELVMAAQKARGILCASKGFVSLRHNGKGAAIADIGDPNVCIVIMSLQGDVGATNHEWAREPLAVPPVAVAA